MGSGRGGSGLCRQVVLCGKWEGGSGLCRMVVLCGKWEGGLVSVDRWSCVGSGRGEWSL